jgi:putative endonuclease
MKKPMQREFYVYIITNNLFGTLYIGMTGNLPRRMFEHKHKLIEGFAKEHGCDKLVYYENYPTAEEASMRERRMKKWNRDWKIQLIEKNNRDWNDLSNQLI